MTPTLTVRSRWLATAVAVGASLTMAPSAFADSAQTGYFNLAEQTQTVSGAYSTGRATQEYRFMANNTKATVMSFNYCADYSNYVSSTYSANNTNYRGLGSWLNGTCLKLRGRTTSGSGSLQSVYGNMLF